MVAFLAEQGGFMKQATTQSLASLAEKQDDDSRNVSRQRSRYSSGSDDFNLPRVSQPQPDRAPFPVVPGANSHETNGHDVLSMSHSASHDDSGIGIRTPDEDFPMEKFAFPADRQRRVDGCRGTAPQCGTYITTRLAFLTWAAYCPGGLLEILVFYYHLGDAPYTFL